MKRRDDLARPRREAALGLRYDRSAFGRFAESAARYIGSARFLAIQTCLVAVWLTLNVFVVTLRWDPYPFILLNLMFSVQAAYAAPLILLAQNRQERRDREQAEIDRGVAIRTHNDAEFLAREIASIRIALAALPTSDEIRDQLERIEERLSGSAGTDR
ncbi:MAG: DUF1003 domain-containing protein [Acidimicrobiia bacterium]